MLRLGTLLTARVTRFAGASRASSLLTVFSRPLSGTANSVQGGDDVFTLLKNISDRLAVLEETMAQSWRTIPPAGESIPTEFINKGAASKRGVEHGRPPKPKCAAEEEPDSVATAASMLSTKGDRCNEVVFAQSDDTLEHCSSIMYEYDVGALIVADAGRVLGLITGRDIVGALAQSGNEALSRTSSDYMTPVENLICVSDDTNLDSCLYLMRKHEIRHLPVHVPKSNADEDFQTESLIGIMSSQDVTSSVLNGYMCPHCWQEEEDRKMGSGVSYSE